MKPVKSSGRLPIILRGEDRDDVPRMNETLYTCAHVTDTHLYRCIRIPALRNQPVCWTQCGDDRHPTPELFHDGLPEERDFEMCY